MPKRSFKNRRLNALKFREEHASAQQYILYIARNVFFVLVFIGFVVVAFLGFKVGMALMDVPDLAFLEKYNPVQTIQVYDKNDKLVVAVQGSEQRIIVPLSMVSRSMQIALLAAEDHRFYEHHGVSPAGIARAFLSNVSHGKVVEGGSTITQQLAKNLFFEGKKRSIDLKIAELLIAVALENRFKKDKILELYLNEVYFGNNAYGIEQAARNYFGKHASELDYAESAFLAGIIRSPSRGGSAENRAAAMRRQRSVLEKMSEYNFISPEELQAAAQENLVFKSFGAEPAKLSIQKYPYYVSACIEMLKGRYNAASIERQGLKIYTNLDCGAQEAAERALASGLARAPYGINQGALVSIRVADGAVVALVGGVGDYMSNQWNCATNPHTAGSAFKPFVYLAGFEKGVIEEYGMIEDAPFSMKDHQGKEYKPKNYDGKFLGGITVAKAFAYSRNIPALKIAQSVGVDSIISVAERAGVKEVLAPHLSLALGCSAVSPLNLGNSYATFARGGMYMSPSLVRRVETRSGKVLENFYPESSAAFDRNTVAQLVDLMQDCVAEGTGQLAKLPDRPVAGKTGTADQGKDLWFVGFTPDLVTAVWGGNKDNKAVGGSATGGTIMTRIFRDYNLAYYRRNPAPAGFFVACNRGAQGLGSDKPLEPVKTSSSYSGGSYSSYSAYSSRKRKRNTATRRAVSQSRGTPSGAAVVRADSGVTEYSWSRR